MCTHINWRTFVKRTPKQPLHVFIRTDDTHTPMRHPHLYTFDIKKSTIHHSQTNRKVNSSTARYDKSTYRQQKAGKWYDSPGKFAEKSRRQAHARSRFFYPEQLFLAAHLLQETESSRFILYFIHYTYCCVRVDYIVYETPVCSGGNNNDGARAPIVNRFNIEKKSPR